MQEHKEKMLHLTKIFGETVKDYRIKCLKKSLNKMANEYGLNPATLSKIENAERECKLGKIWLIAEAMELKPSELIKIVEDNLGKNFTFFEE